MSTIHPECPGSDPSDRLEGADALLRQEPDEEEDEEEDKGDGKEDGRMRMSMMTTATATRSERASWGEG